MSEYQKVKVDGVTHSKHKYVWEHANGPVPKGYVVHHINHVKTDNRLENLMLMTYQEHSDHHNRVHPTHKMCAVCQEFYEPPVKHRGRSKVCSQECKSRLLSDRMAKDNPMLKIGPDQREEILVRLRAGESGKDLAKIFEVSQATISAIKNGKR